MKASEIGPGAKVPHLSYVGDATIGAGTNIGAATIVANYDGVAKHRTVVGEQVRTGSDTVLVAPVTVGDGAYTAAGSVITEDVPAGRARHRPGPAGDQDRLGGAAAAGDAGRRGGAAAQAAHGTEGREQGDG